MYMDDIKLFAKKKKKKKENELEPLIQTIIIYSQDVGMELGIEKCVMPVKKRGKRITEGTELLNKKRMRTLGEKENYKYLGILEVYTIK